MRWKGQGRAQKADKDDEKSSLHGVLLMLA